MFSSSGCCKPSRLEIYPPSSYFPLVPVFNFLVMQCRCACPSIILNSIWCTPIADMWRKKRRVLLRTSDLTSLWSDLIDLPPCRSEYEAIWHHNTMQVWLVLRCGLASYLRVGLTSLMVWSGPIHPCQSEWLHEVMWPDTSMSVWMVAWSDVTWHLRVSLNSCMK